MTTVTATRAAHALTEGMTITTHPHTDTHGTWRIGKPPREIGGYVEVDVQAGDTHQTWIFYATQDIEALVTARDAQTAAAHALAHLLDCYAKLPLLRWTIHRDGILEGSADTAAEVHTWAESLGTEASVGEVNDSRTTEFEINLMGAHVAVYACTPISEPALESV